MSIPLGILVVEDSEDDVALLLRELRRGGYDPAFERVDTPQAMEEALDRQSWDLIISDHNMPHFSGPAALRLVQQKGLDLPFIILSGVIGEGEAVAAMKTGAHDYIMKGNLARLIPAVERELREAEQRRQRKRLEEEILQSRKMESLGRLAGGVAHDFNNMLTSIMGHAQLAAMRLPQGDPARAHIEEIEKSSERASNLTRQLLTVSRRQVVESRVINLNHLIMELVPMLRSLIGVDIELATQLRSDLGRVKVDPGQLEQVLLNLVVNARDALPHGGQIVIETANVTLDQADTRQRSDTSATYQVMLSVSDNGLGMNEEVKAHLFEPFFTTKEEGKGTGLGLAICYGIVKQNGGDIEVSSELGRGTAFRIYLAQTEEMPADPRPGVARENRLLEGKETVLLAEDEPVVRTMIASMLQDQGYTVLQAANGVEALQLAQEHAGKEIDLLLTDVVMPQMGGVELANQFSAIRPEAKVLFTSGHPDQLFAHQRTICSNTQFIQKPFAPSALSHKVREVLDQ